MALGKAFLDSYHELNVWSLEKDRKSFHKVHKHHTFIHLLKNSKFLNPKLQWCFKGEDMMKKVRTLATHCFKRLNAMEAPNKIARHYRIAHHFAMSSVDKL